MRPVIWTAVAALAALVLWAVWLVTTHERAARTVPVPPSSDAMRDRFLAAQRLLDTLGVRSRRVVGMPADLPAGSGQVLVVPARRGALAAYTAQRLHSAAQSGAHLIVESELPDKPDPLFDALGITRKEASHAGCPDESDSDAGSWPKRRTASLPVDSPTLMPVDGLGDPVLRAEMRGAESLSAKADVTWQVQRCGDVRMLHFTLGQGRVTALNDLRFATNGWLGRNDNAELLHRLVKLGGAPAEVWFLESNAGGLWEWLRLYAIEVLLALGALVVFALWRAAPRFGPQAPDPEPMRRRLLDHLRASGRLLWAHGARHPLAEAARSRALEHAARTFPALRGMQAAEQVQVLVQRHGLSAAHAALIAGTTPANDAGRFIALIRACRLLNLRGRAATARHHDPLYDETEQSP